MRKTLQRKFVRTAMAAVSALLLLLLVGFNLFNWYQVNQQTDRMLQTVLENDSLQTPALPPQSPEYPPAPAWQEVLPPELQEDIQQVARHRLLAMLALSTGGVALCWLGMLALVVLLSRRTIEPVAASIEKQKQFVTNAGHELKTPLAILQANAEALTLHQGESRWTRNIQAQIHRLDSLTENLLTLARMEEGADLPVPKPVDFSALTLELAQTFREPAALKGIALEMQVTEGCIVQADRGHMAQLISILLDNAVKYTESGGVIHLCLEREGKGLCLRVKNGPAQMPREPTRLFERFYRGDPARTQGTGGCGVGLSAAQAIVQAWKGTLSAEAEGEDTMVFTLCF